MTFTEFQACLLYFLIDVLPFETTHTQFSECHLLENSENFLKVLILYGIILTLTIVLDIFHEAAFIGLF